MSAFLSDILTTSYEFIDVGRNMLQSCQRKQNKVQTDSRYILSFFFRRALEMFESFLILIKARRFADSAILLRSFWEMGFKSGYIFENQKEKEHRALLYRLKEMQIRKEIIEANLDDFRNIDSNIDAKKARIVSEMERGRRMLSEHWPSHRRQQFPNIRESVNSSHSVVLKRAYDQFYRYYSNIEHHSTIFARDYVDDDKCEPLEEPKTNTVLEPEINVITFRFVFLVILKTFNEEFR